MVKFLASLGWGGGLTEPPSKLRLTEPLFDPWNWPLREVSAGSADPQLKITLDVPACELVYLTMHTFLYIAANYISPWYIRGVIL